MSLELPAETRLTDRKRAAIVAAAVKEFEACGFDNTSMNKIAETAEVSKRTVYNHFESKDALFLAIVQELLDATEKMPDFDYQADRSLVDQLTEKAHRVTELFTSDSFQGLVRVTLSRFLMAPELAQQTIGDQKRFRVRLVRWLEEAVADGKLKIDDCEFAAAQFCGLLQTFTFWPQAVGLEPQPSPEVRKRVIDSTVEMFLSRYAV
ncbi:TetR/AcrR family transcriptional regulator [Blastopirellula sp. JC732]|uniref:TetR/AcrR family transcriptional regulator n=1 Tax=Blastopirellula sediminis TaxID=2894196 RepID=A0A9X1MRU4_9BACT|nr:TetR/AcrR family transcriptional regulator [Blastopirellula sediminis]MCC9606248.1 TetR/AcrR family transcriptional regulator [Blastopirellula sediminis]MCC9630454.1 TetR/AcrR family transcriptional regulator [Blastopirellula sediminis]